MSEGGSIVLLILFGLYSITEFTSVYLVLKRRHLQPLKFRDPILLISSEMAFYLSTASGTFFQIMPPSDNCLFKEMFVIPGLFSIALVLGRFWKLLAISLITSARLRSDFNTWILRNLWVCNSKYLWASIAVVGISLNIVHMAAAMSFQECYYSSASQVLLSAYILLFLFGLVTMIWKLRSVEDAFYVSNELKMLGAVILGSYIILAAIGSSAKFQSVVAFIMIIVGWFENLIQMWFPVIKSYDAKFGNSHRTDYEDLEKSSLQTSVYTNRDTRYSITQLNHKSSLRDVLTHPEGYIAFKQFVTLEFSVENLLCWTEVTAYLHCLQPDKVQEQFLNIYNLFIRIGAPNEVNISAPLKIAFKCITEGREVDLDILYSIPPSMNWMTLDPSIQNCLKLLKRLQHDILKLMHDDSYSRFKLTAEYLNLMQIRPSETKITLLRGLIPRISTSS